MTSRPTRSTPWARGPRPSLFILPLLLAGSMARPAAAFPPPEKFKDSPGYTSYYDNSKMTQELQDIRLAQFVLRHEVTQHPTLAALNARKAEMMAKLRADKEFTDATTEYAHAVHIYSGWLSDYEVDRARWVSTPLEPSLKAELERVKAKRDLWYKSMVSAYSIMEARYQALR